ncbi:MAG: lysophospholipid acyltransferase family protein [Elusimicrobiota bacterium]
MKSLTESAAFQERLRTTGSYRTDPARRRPFFGRFDFWYVLRVAHLIYEGNRLAVRGEFNTETWAAHSLSYVSIIEDCGGTLDISGLEHSLRPGRPVVYVGNHMSMMESFLLPGLLLSGGWVTAVIKKSLGRYPVLGAFARATEPIMVGRENPREDLKTVLGEGRESLAKGRSVVLFPQATRSAVFDPSAFNSLGVKLAKSAGVPVVPLALKTDFQRNGRILKDIGGLDRSKTVCFRFGEPLEVTGTGKDANEKVMRFISDALKEWGG